jgi:hypothetical protein
MLDIRRGQQFPSQPVSFIYRSVLDAGPDDAGIEGARRGKRVRTTKPDPGVVVDIPRQ